MKILLWGASGQLGQEIAKRADAWGHEIITPAPSVDIGDSASVAHQTSASGAGCVLNCAAYTAVDKAESEPELCDRVNVNGAELVSQEAIKIGARTILVSTDYVFPGTATAPLLESAAIDPVNHYGASKAEGEKRVLENTHGEALVVRTSSLHGAYGENFVKTMLRLFSEREELRVVHDQIMSPTWAGWLAESLLHLVEAKASGIVHASEAGQISWFEFASAILEEASFDKDPRTIQKLLPISSSEYPTPAARPAYSVLDCSKLEAILGTARPDWRSGLKNHLRERDRLGSEGIVYG